MILFNLMLSITFIETIGGAVWFLVFTLWLLSDFGGFLSGIYNGKGYKYCIFFTLKIIWNVFLINQAYMYIILLINLHDQIKS